MKLRNKHTGEIKEFALFDGEELQGGATLESLTKEWEDVPVQNIPMLLLGCVNSKNDGDLELFEKLCGEEEK